MDPTTILQLLGNPNLSQAQAQMLLGTLNNFFSQTSGFARTQLNAQTNIAQQGLNLQQQQLTQNGALTREQLAQNDQQFQADLQLKREELERLQIPQLQINKQLADMEDEHFKAQLGLSYLTQASQFAASDPFALSDFMRGATKNPGVPQYLQNLMNGVAQGTGGAVGPEAPKPATLDNLNKALGGPGSTTGGAAPAAGGTTQVAPGVTVNAGAAPVTNYGSPSAPRYNAPGPNSPNDTAAGTLMPGTTGMMQGATQNFGYGPGQGSQSISGTRGTNAVSYDPATGRLVFDANFLQPKSKAVFNLWDETTNSNFRDNSAIEGATKGNGSGWNGAYYVPVPAGNGRFAFTGVQGIDPTHQYSIRTALPDEGGGVGNEQRFSGSTILGLPTGGQQSSGPAGEPAKGPGVSGYVVANGRIYSADAQGHPLDDSGVAATAAEGSRAGSMTELGWKPAGSAPAAAPAAPVGPAAPAGPATPAPVVGPAGFPQTSPAELAMSFLFNRGADKMAPGTLESLTPEEMANLGEGVNKLYGQQAMPSFLEAYRRSRPPQTAAQGSFFSG